MTDTPKPEGAPGVGASQTGDGQGAPGQAGNGGAGAGAEPSAQVPPPTPAARIAELEGQIADLTDRLLRAHAEMDNVRKRTEREKADTARYAISNFAHDVVGVTDNFQRAIAAVPAGAAEADPALKSLIEGVLVAERAFLQVLERHGVKQIDPKGDAFNPHLHQAVMEQENTEVAAGTVLQVFQPGYVIAERVLRPAMVVVSRGGAKPAREPPPVPPAPGAANENAEPSSGEAASSETRSGSQGGGA